MTKRIFLLTWYLCFGLFVAAQTIDNGYANDSTAAPADTVEMQNDAFVIPVIRKISHDTLNALKAQKDFAYMQYIDSAFRHKKKVANSIDQSKPTPGLNLFSNRGLRTLYWLLAMVAAGWVLFKMLVGKSSLFSFSRKMTARPVALAATEKNSPPQDLLADAINAKNYRLAVRYLYLQTIQTLGAKQQLHIAPQKTNYQYVQEITPKKLQQMFALLTMHYEYAWFGEFNLSSTQFNKIRQEFEQFNHQIGS